VTLLDTHILGLVGFPPGYRLQSRHRDLLDHGADRVFGVSIISFGKSRNLSSTEG